MKRIISCFTAILLLVSVFYPVSVFAADVDEPTFAVSSAHGNPGKNVSVAINIDNNPGVASVKLKVSFDSGLILDSVDYNDTQLGGRSQQPETLTSPVTLNWFNGEADTEGNITYAVLNFTVAQDAYVGDHPVTITYDEDDVYNIAEHNIPFKIINGSVNVTIPVEGLSLDKQSMTVETADVKVRLTPIFTPENATNKNVTWRSTNPKIATVENGVVTLLKRGVVTIIATSDDGGFRAGCALTILCSHLDTEDIPAEASTCIKQGHEAYTVCLDCGEVISGSDAPLPLAAHRYVKEVQEQYLKTPATCVSRAVYYKSCYVCGEAGTDTFIYGSVNPDAHSPADPVRENETPAAFEHDGEYDEVVYCSLCGAELSREHKSIPKLYILGDVDGSREIEITDATWIQRAVASISAPFVPQIGPSDVDGDGEITLVDATYIQAYLAYIEIDYDIGKVIG